MPPLPASPGALALKYQFQLASGQNAYTHHYLHTTSSSVSTSQLQALANAAQSAFSSNLAAAMSSAWKLFSVTAFDLGPAPNPPGINLTTVTGGISGTNLTAETCLLVNMQIGRRYRGGKPRQYWPFGTATQLNTPQQWNPAWVTTVRGFYMAYLNALTSAISGGPVVDNHLSISYHSGGALRPTPVQDVVLGWSINPIPGSARRRMGR